MQDEAVIYRCDAIRDAAGVRHRPGQIVVRRGAIVSAGEVSSHPDGRVVPVPGLVMPAFVNAHAHLELTRIGPRPYDGDFTRWIRMVLANRPASAPELTAALTEGARQSLAAGVATVGDIGGGRFDASAGVAAMHAAGLTGIAFLELLGISGEILQQSLAQLAQLRGMATPPSQGGVGGGSSQRPPFAPVAQQFNGRPTLPQPLPQRKGGNTPPSLCLGLQPHAPYSTSRKLYEGAVEQSLALGLPLTTHLAETKDEAQFVASATGRFRHLLESLGRWRDEIARDYGAGLTPVQWMQPHLQRARWLLAHCNYLSNDDIAVLAQTQTSVAYCPVASEYFGHRDHRYRDLIAAGVNVCLGTDSIICQPEDEPQPLGILPQMRRLYQRDRTDPDLLLAMATTRGMTALSRDPRDATLLPGSPARLISVRFDPDDPTDELTQILLSRYPVEPVTF